MCHIAGYRATEGQLLYLCEQVLSQPPIPVEIRHKTAFDHVIQAGWTNYSNLDPKGHFRAEIDQFKAISSRGHFGHS